MTFHIKSSSYHHYACTMPIISVLCLLFLYYAYYCTMPVLSLLCLFITTNILNRAATFT